MSSKNLATYGDNDRINQLMNEDGDVWFIFDGPIVYGDDSAFVKAAKFGYYRCFDCMFEKYKYEIKKYNFWTLLFSGRITEGHVKIFKHILEYESTAQSIYSGLHTLYAYRSKPPTEIVKSFLKKELCIDNIIEDYYWYNKIINLVKEHGYDWFAFKKGTIEGDVVELIKAADCGNYEQFILLFEKYKHEIKNFNILDIICEQKLTDGHNKIIKFVMQYDSLSKNLNKALLNVCIYNYDPSIEIIKLFLKKGADIGKTIYDSDHKEYNNEDSCLVAVIRHANFKLARFFIEIAKPKGIEYYDCIFEIARLFHSYKETYVNRNQIVQLFDILIDLPGFDATLRNTVVREEYEDEWREFKATNTYTFKKEMFKWRINTWYDDDFRWDKHLEEEDKQIYKYFKWRVYHHGLVSEFKSSTRDYIKTHIEHQTTIKYLLESKIMTPAAIFEFNNAWKNFKFHSAVIKLAALNNT